MGTSIFSFFPFGGYVQVVDDEWSITTIPNSVTITSTEGGDGWYVCYMPDLSFNERLDIGVRMFFARINKLF